MKHFILLLFAILALSGCISHNIEYACDKDGKPFVDANGEQYKVKEEYKYVQPEYSPNKQFKLGLKGVGL